MYEKNVNESLLKNAPVSNLLKTFSHVIRLYYFFLMTGILFDSEKSRRSELLVETEKKKFPVFSVFLKKFSD